MRAACGYGASATGPELSFADGSTATADVVIGADGTHSVVRDAVLNADAPGPPRFSGVCAYRCLVPAQRAPEFALRPVQTLWLGPGHHFVHYPISAGRYVNVVAFAPAGDWRIESWTAEGRIEDLRAEFAGWDPQLTSLLAAADRTGRWALLDRDPLPPLDRWAARGDRRRRASDVPVPRAGGRAGDRGRGRSAAGCLAADQGDPPAALCRYETLRKPRASQVQLLSHLRLDANHLPDGPEQQARDAAFAGADPLAHNAWIYGHDPEEDVTEPSR